MPSSRCLHRPSPAPAAGRGRAGGASPGTIGARGEELAAAHLRRLGFSILARNARTAAGEIDLVAGDGRALVFVEVKTALAGAGRPAAAPLERLAPRQRSRLRRLAVAWLCARGRVRPRAEVIRFDAIGVLLDGRGRLLALEHLESAW